MTLAEKFSRLKRQVGGNREHLHYEETFGQPREEYYGITMPNPWNRRILSELEFGIRLSQEANGAYDAAIDGALDYLLAQIAEQGALTNAACAQAEGMLASLSKAAKEYKLILAAHAHIDMNWMWGWQETVAITVATFKTMLALMRDYPQFHFSQSQASVYHLIEKYAPEMMDEIKQRIQEGRWEVTASAWVETDKNMPSTESLLNHVYYTRKYLSETWGVDPATLDIDFSPDTFGHSANLPELDSLMGVKYYYHCRGLDGDNAAYRWRAPSGKELLVYREQYWYNSGVTPAPAIGLIDVAKRSGGLKTGLAVYGVGDHGGGATRRDVERGLEMQEWPVFPEIVFGTFHDYFHAAEQVREKLPLVDREMNFIFTGCYTTQSRVKMGNRHTEASLYESQLWDTLASQRGLTKYNERMYEDAWRNVLFTHFHDILTGSCVQETREHALGLYQDALGASQTRATLAQQAIAAEIDTSSVKASEPLPSQCVSQSQSEGAGGGFGISPLMGVPSPERGAGLTRVFYVFNSSERECTRVVALTVWDWVGDLRYFEMVDADGNRLPFQLVDHEQQNYWDHKYFRLQVETTVPCFGYGAIVLQPVERDEYALYYQPSVRSHKPTPNTVLENDNIRAEFCFMNGELVSLLDKQTGKELLMPGESGGVRYLTTDCHTSNAWQIGRYTSIQRDSFQINRVLPEQGELVNSLTIESSIRSSKVKAVYSLEKGAKALSLKLEVDWGEAARGEEPVPVLIYQLPIADAKRFLYDVPGGAQYREPMQLDVPGLTYGAAIGDNGRATFISADSKYGYRGSEFGLCCTLINTANSPDPYPERGIHHVQLFIGVEKACPKALQAYTFELLHPFTFQSGGIHAGKLPMKGSLLSAACGSAAIDAIFTRDGEAYAHVSELVGKAGEVKLGGADAKLEAYTTREIKL